MPNLLQRGNIMKPTEIVVIADRSGSMSSLAADVVGGFNTFLAEQQALSGEANLTLHLFDHEFITAIASVPLADIRPLDKSSYVPRGSTALFDAIGLSMVALKARNPERAILCIITDGQENASQKYTRDQVRTTLADAAQRGWEVVYLAANQDAFSVGNSFGNVRGQNVNFEASSLGTRSAFMSASVNTTSYRIGDSTPPSHDDLSMLVAASVANMSSSSSSSSCDSSSSSSSYDSGSSSSSSSDSGSCGGGGE